MVAMRWQRTEKGKEARRESMKDGRDYTPFTEEHRELTPSEENVSGCVTKALNKDTLVGVDRLYTMGNAKPNRSCLGANRTPEVGNEKRSIRRLTPVECERLQGFPDNWTEGVSDTQRYKQMGNAVTVNVIEEIGKRILEVWK